MSGAYTSLRISSARSEVTPTTSRLGRSVSSTANPSRKNSGFHANSTFGFIFARSDEQPRSLFRPARVDLPTMSDPLSACGASASTDESTYERSAAQAIFLLRASYANEMNIAISSIREIGAKCESTRLDFSGTTIHQAHGSKNGTLPWRRDSTFD
jgi:hypothetical protein